MVILSCAMLLASVCGQVDVVLISTGRSALSLANGLVALAVNVGVDVALIPRYGITGAAIGWAAAIAVSNLVPLVQLTRIAHVHPFGTGTILACALSALGFGVIPLLVSMAFGRDATGSILAVLAGCAAFAAGSWHWRQQLRLSMIPRPRVCRRGFSPTVLPGRDSHPEVT
jgi:O-antigen/teichoic acid export membrane protein